MAARSRSSGGSGGVWLLLFVAAARLCAGSTSATHDAEGAPAQREHWRVHALNDVALLAGHLHLPPGAVLPSLSSDGEEHCGVGGAWSLHVAARLLLQQAAEEEEHAVPMRRKSQDPVQSSTAQQLHLHGCLRGVSTGSNRHSFTLTLPTSPNVPSIIQPEQPGTSAGAAAPPTRAVQIYATWVAVAGGAEDRSVDLRASSWLLPLTGLAAVDQHLDIASMPSVALPASLLELLLPRPAHPSTLSVSGDDAATAAASDREAQVAQLAAAVCECSHPLSGATGMHGDAQPHDVQGDIEAGAHVALEDAAAVAAPSPQQHQGEGDSVVWWQQRLCFHNRGDDAPTPWEWLLLGMAQAVARLDQWVMPPAGGAGTADDGTASAQEGHGGATCASLLAVCVASALVGSGARLLLGLMLCSTLRSRRVRAGTVPAAGRAKRGDLDLAPSGAPAQRAGSAHGAGSAHAPPPGSQEQQQQQQGGQDAAMGRLSGRAMLEGGVSSLVGSARKALARLSGFADAAATTGAGGGAGGGGGGGRWTRDADGRLQRVSGLAAAGAAWWSDEAAAAAGLEQQPHHTAPSDPE